MELKHEIARCDSEESQLLRSALVGGEAAGQTASRAPITAEAKLMPANVPLSPAATRVLRYLIEAQQVNARADEMSNEGIASALSDLSDDDVDVALGELVLRRFISWGTEPQPPGR